jgi:hypothetical protein
MSADLGVVLPAYRPDVDRLRDYVRAIETTLSPSAIRIELDDPREGVAERVAGWDVTLQAVPYRRGKGAAITAGFEALETDVRAFADADASTPADSLADVVAPVAEGIADLGVGSRRHPDAEVDTHQTRGRRYLGDGFAWLARRLLTIPLYDYQCGAKAITADGWTAVREHLYEAGFAWDVELVAIAGALDLRVREVPIEWQDQPGSTVSPVRTAIRLARALVASRHRAKQLTDSRVHEALAARRGNQPALVERE